MNRSDFERHVRENVKLVEAAPGRWIGKVPIPGLPVLQPFLIFLLQTAFEPRDGSSGTASGGGAIVVGIKPPMRIPKDNEGVLEYLLKANAAAALGAFAVVQEGELIVSAELPCGTISDSYFSREDLDLMVGSLMAMIRSHYTKILQLARADEPRAANRVRDLLGIGRSSTKDASSGD